MSTSILVASLYDDQNHAIQTQLQPILTVFDDFNLTGALMKDVANFLQDAAQSIDLVLLNFEEFDATEVAIIEFIRRKGYEKPLIVLARDIPDEVVTLLFGRSSVGFLRKPLVLNDALKMFRAALSTGTVERRNHRRNPVNEIGDLQVEGSELWESIRVRDLSLGGAKVEISKAIDSKVGQAARLRIKLPQMNRFHLLPCAVCWSKLKDDDKGMFMGLSFTGPGMTRPIK